MHEASLMNDLMSKILAAVETSGVRVTRVSIWLGALSHMSPAHFREHYEDAAKDTPAEGAKLDISVSDDMNHDNAQSIILESIEVTS